MALYDIDDVMRELRKLTEKTTYTGQALDTGIHQMYTRLLNLEATIAALCELQQEQLNEQKSQTLLLQKIVAALPKNEEMKLEGNSTPNEALFK